MLHLTTDEQENHKNLLYFLLYAEVKVVYEDWPQVDFMIISFPEK